MITRRTFIGSAVACGTLSGLVSPLTAAVPVSDRPLNWQCDIIQTVQHNDRQRASIVTGVSIQPSGNQIAIVGDDHYVCVFDTKQNRFSNHLGSHSDWVRVARFSPNGRTLATAGNDRKLKIWNTSEYKQEPQVFSHQNAVIDLAFTSDSKQIATVGFGPKLSIFDLESNSLVKTLECDCPDNHAVAFSSDDQWIAAGGRSGKIRIWNLRTGQLFKTLNGHRQRIRSIQFTENGEIVSCGDDQVVRIQHLQTGRERKLPRHSSKLFSVAMLGNDLLATAGSDNRIHIWRLSATKNWGRWRDIQGPFPV